jgi:hypothetical protein
MSLARASDDPVHKQRYEDLALEFAQSAVGEPDLEIAASLLPSAKALRPAATPVRTNRHFAAQSMGRVRPNFCCDKYSSALSESQRGSRAIRDD